ncbi:hypothetical protein IJJ37_02745 [Candidatus Saccharibacteria bacterium]|nr:hypothetical protein [Candidatus Saccharibacteria bacterium]
MKKKSTTDTEQIVINKVVLGSEDPLENPPDPAKARPVATSSDPTPPRRKLSLIVFILGLIALIGGAAYLIVALLSRPAVPDAEFLVSVGAWKRSDVDGVIWNFTNIGDGTLTTNNHTNDYNFLWAIDGGALKIETDWLYTLNNEYKYELDQSAKVLTLTLGDDYWTFIPAAAPESGSTTPTEKAAVPEGEPATKSE